VRIASHGSVSIRRDSVHRNNAVGGRDPGCRDYPMECGGHDPLPLLLGGRGFCDGTTGSGA